MGATDCVFYKVCRYQQTVVRAQKEAGLKPDPCWAEDIACSDQKDDVATCCRFFKPLRVSVEQLRLFPSNGFPEGAST